MTSQLLSFHKLFLMETCFAAPVMLVTYRSRDTFGAADHNFPKWCCGSDSVLLRRVARSPGDGAHWDCCKKIKLYQDMIAI